MSSRSRKILELLKKKENPVNAESVVTPFEDGNYSGHLLLNDGLSLFSESHCDSLVESSTPKPQIKADCVDFPSNYESCTYIELRPTTIKPYEFNGYVKGISDPQPIFPDKQLHTFPSSTNSTINKGYELDMPDKLGIERTKYHPHSEKQDALSEYSHTDCVEIQTVLLVEDADPQIAQILEDADTQTDLLMSYADPPIAPIIEDADLQTVLLVADTDPQTPLILEVADPQTDLLMTYADPQIATIIEDADLQTVLLVADTDPQTPPLLEDNDPQEDRLVTYADPQTAPMIKDTDLHTVMIDADLQTAPLRETVSPSLGKSRSTGRPKKGRKRKIIHQSRESRKKFCQTNKEYIDQRGKGVEPREFRDFNCKCRCNEKVSVMEREKEFQKFWNLESYEAKALYMSSVVTVNPIVRKRKKDSDRRNYSRVYHLGTLEVCKSIFLQTLRISSCRVDAYLKKTKHLETIVIKDNRGSTGGRNKITSQQEHQIIDHINKYPRYKSHYSRSKTEKEYLPYDTTLPVMYAMYKEEYSKPVSFSTYKKVFYSKFNLKRKPLKKDTCNMCDSLTAQKTSAKGDIKAELEEKHVRHQDEAKFAQDLMKDDLRKAKESPFLEVLTFDMQKTLPLPKISTNIVFYKRVLWLYNCGVHSGSSGKNFCYLWLEGEAGREVHKK